MFAPRIRLKPLAALCHRLAIATSAGIKDFKVWQSEAERGSRTQQKKVEQVVAALTAGNPLPVSLTATGNYFPKLFRQMVEVGDESGQMDRTYKRLAEHYDRALAAKRSFLGKLAWPAFQFGIALLVVGLLIAVMGVLPKQEDGEAFDILGFGLVGTSGLIRYLNFLIVCAILSLLLIEAFRRGAAWIKPIQRAIMVLPMVGQAFQTLALARFTWAFQLVLGTSMDLRKALPLALDATGNDYYARFGREVALRVENGQDIHSSLAATGVFPKDLLDSIAVGEESGRLAELMERLSNEYQERAGSAISILAQAAGYLIWLMVAAMIVMLIFQLFSSYVGVLNQAAQPI
ncbi:MAG: type II secretion system F family protein [Planctomycetota bacterium]